MTVMAATFGALSEVQLMHAIYHFKAQEANNPMLQTVRNSELKRRSYSHCKSITPSWRKHFAKYCEITLLLRSDFAAFLYRRVYFLMKLPDICRKLEAGNLKMEANFAASLLLRSDFAALLECLRNLADTIFSCEMVPGASRYLLLTLGDILHQIFVV